MSEGMKGMRMSEREFEALTLRRAIGPEVRKPPLRKYRNEPVTTEDGRFDSKLEARRCRELRLLLRQGEIQALARQVEFMLAGGIVYRADFMYEIASGTLAGTVVIEDAKGVKTKEYRLKKRLMAAAGYAITEVGGPRNKEKTMGKKKAPPPKGGKKPTKPMPGY